METILELKKCVTDFTTLQSSDIEDRSLKLKVYSDVSDLLVCNQNNVGMDGTIFSLFIEMGKEKTLMLDLPIDDLELFASSILKHIKIIRKTYGKQIAIQSETGSIGSI